MNAVRYMGLRIGVMQQTESQQFFYP
jgi:hypothetical protein